MPEIIHDPSSIIHRRQGVALLMVLLIVMAITIISMGFVTRMDTELACGSNTLVRMQMDQLAESGLEHARGLLLHPQEVPPDQNGLATYWKGEPDLQLIRGSHDYYDIVSIKQPDPCDYCTYDITCDAYRRKDTEKTGESRLWAKLRLDPCIALWLGTTASTTLWNGLTICGDVYSKDGLVNLGTIEGDVFAASLSGGKTGQLNPQTISLAWPVLTAADFTSRYSCGSLSGPTFGPYDPPRVCYNAGDLILTGGTQIYGMLLVQGNLTVRGVNNVITAGKNLPALYVTGKLIVEKGAGLTVTGLAAARDDISIGDNATVSVLGGLFGHGRLAQVQTADDQSGNGNTATLCNMPVWQPAGFLGGALQLDGIDDYGQTANSSMRLRVTDAYSLSVWIKPNGTQKSWAGIISKTTPAGTDNHWTLQFNSDGNRLIIYHPGGSWDTGITLTQVAGAWHHVVIVRDGSGITSYLDPVGSSPPHHKTESWTVAPGYGNGHLNIGAERTASASSVYGGLLDDLRVYGRALGASEVASPVSVTALLGYWTFDEKAPRVTITAEPMKAAIVVWPGGTATHWSPVAGGFFKSIRRWEP